jgi:hypothetical protein
LFLQVWKRRMSWARHSFHVLKQMPKMTTSNTTVRCCVWSLPSMKKRQWAIQLQYSSSLCYFCKCEGRHQVRLVVLFMF